MLNMHLVEDQTLILKKKYEKKENVFHISYTEPAFHFICKRRILLQGFAFIFTP